MLSLFSCWTIYPHKQLGFLYYGAPGWAPPSYGWPLTHPKHHHDAGFAVCRHRKVHKREETQAEMMAHRWRLEREFGALPRGSRGPQAGGLTFPFLSLGHIHRVVSVAFKPQGRARVLGPAPTPLPRPIAVNERKGGKTAGGAVTREALEKARQARMAGATPPPAAPPTGYGLGAAGRPTPQAATPMTATPGSVSRGPAVTPSSIAPSSAEPQRSGSARGLFSSRSARSTPSPSVAGPPTYTASFPSPSTDNLPVDADTGVELMPDKSYSSGGPPSGGSWSKKGLGGLFSKK